MRGAIVVCFALFGVSYATARWLKPTPGGTGNAPSEADISPVLIDRIDGLSASGLTDVMSSLEGLNTSDEFIERWGQTPDRIQRRLLLGRWSGVDPEGASAFLSAHGQYEALSDLMKCWVARDPRAAISHYKSEREKWTRNGPWESELYRIALEHGPEKMIDLAIEFDMHMRVNDITVMDDAFERWAHIDLESALKKAEGLPIDTRSNVYAESIPRVNGFAGIGKARARQNVDEALAWARGLAARDAGPALHGIVATLIEDDPNAVIPYLEELERPFEYSGAQVGAGSMAVIAMINEDPVKALQWIADNVHRQDQSDVIDSVFTQHALISSPQQLPSAIASVSDSKVQEMAMMGIRRYTDSKDVGAALVATLDLPEDDRVRPKLLRTFLDSWTKESPAHARTHLEEEGARYGALAQEYLDKLSRPEPEQKGPVTIEFGP